MGYERHHSVSSPPELVNHPSSPTTKTNIENKVSSSLVRATASAKPRGRLPAKAQRLLPGAGRADRLEKIVAEIRTAECRNWTSAARGMQTFTGLRRGETRAYRLLVNNAEIMLSPLHERMIDVNIRGGLHGIAAGCPRSRRQLGRSSASRPSAGHHVWPAREAYKRHEVTVLAISERLRLKITTCAWMVISPTW